MLNRSILFYLLLGIWTIFMGIVSIPFLLLPSHLLIKPARFWIGGIFLLLKYICKITHEIQGKNNIPDNPIKLPEESLISLSEHHIPPVISREYYFSDERKNWLKRFKN